MTDTAALEQKLLEQKVQESVINLPIRVSTINTVINALGKLPFAEVNGLISELVQVAQPIVTSLAESLKPSSVPVIEDPTESTTER